MSFFSREDFANFGIWLAAQSAFGSIERCTREEVIVFTNNLAVEKKEGRDPRFVGNFKPLNSATLKHKFKGPSPTKIVDWAASFPFLCKVDLKNGYFNMKIEDEVRPLLGFMYKGIYHRHVSLPMGVANGVYYF